MPSWLGELIQRRGGRIRFDQYMESALYDPVHGYYSAQMETVGKSGDFSTSTTLDDSLGQALARWIRAEIQTLQLARPTVIELGSGTGQLARVILSKFRPWEKLRYYVVDVRVRNQPSRRIKQFTLVREALNAADGTAIVFSHEFVDAFPCRRFVRTKSGWDEIWVELQDGRWLERAVPVPTGPESSSLSPRFGIGQTVEVHESYYSWLKGLCSWLHQGALLTIDYGGSPEENYRGKLTGTLRAFFQHQRLDGIEIYRRPGRQDLTADVNFEDLRHWGRALGLSEIGYSTQLDFIQEWYPDAFKREDPVTRLVLNPLGAGTAFKVLHQRKLVSNSGPPMTD
jgi:SAM-dependent MidA family methyltransferase